MAKVLGEPGGLSMNAMNRRPAPQQTEHRKEPVVFTRKPEPAAKPAGTAQDPRAPQAAQRPAQVSARPATAQAARPGTAGRPAAENELVAKLRDMVGGFAVLSDEVLRKNTEMAAGGMSYEDRTVSFECANYVISNLAYIFMGLVMDESFRAAFVDALNLEIRMDDQDEETRAKIRKETRNADLSPSNGSVVMGVTTFLPNVAEELHRKMQAGFTALDPYAKEFDDEVRAMPNDRRIQLGFVFSNYMYLIRAFSHNDMFMGYVITVIEKVKESL